MKRLIDHYRTPKEAWEKVNLRHLALEAQGSQETLIIADAQRPPVHRYRYPQCVAFACLCEA